MKNNSGKLALVTGASSGIGLELSRLFVNDGYDVILVSENADELRSAAQELGRAKSKIETITADLSKPDGARKVYEQVRGSGRELDVLVNNAGVGVYGDFTSETSLERELAMIHLNTMAPVQLTKLFAPHMAERGDGRILFTASVASVMPTPLLAAYGATKAFVYAFSQSLREELRDRGVSVTALMPGPTDTNFFERADAEDSKITDEKLADPASVAKAGYAALMDGDAKVVTPLKYKVQTKVNQVLPEDMVAKQSHKKHERKSEDERDENRL
jgi:short-subunit dehydrogenase